MTFQEDEATLADRVRAVVTSHRGSRGALLPILHTLQAELGYLPQEVSGLLADELNISRADVHGVVTFYSDFRRDPTGRTTIRICRAEACQAVGAQRLVDVAHEQTGLSMGQTSPDGSITLEQVFCLGNCALGPAVQVNGRVLGRFQEDRLRAVLDEVDA